MVVGLTLIEIEHKLKWFDLSFMQLIKNCLRVQDIRTSISFVH